MKLKNIFLTLTIVLTIFLASCVSQPGTTTTIPTDTGGQQNQTTTSTDNGQPPATAVIDTGEFETSKGFTDENGCYDSEGGIFYEKRGFITDAKKNTFEDECISGSSLREVYCGLVGFKDEQSITCDFGCQNGQCLKTGDAGSTACVDSDFKDYYKRGQTTYQGKIEYDSCKDKNTLIEQLCTSVGVPNADEHYCKAGCVNGACNPETVSVNNCVDSDYGAEAEYTKGTVTDPKGSAEDECLNSYTVKEWKCSSVGFRASTNIDCLSRKCVDGACLKN